MSSPFKVLDARWTPTVNMLKVRCPNCHREFETRADRFNARCVCGRKGRVDKDYHPPEPPGKSAEPPRARREESPDAQV